MNAPGPAAGEAPLFPLPNLWLFPGAVLPLYIFEPRYRQLVGDILDAQGRIVLGTVVPGHERELAGTPPVYPVAGLGEIAWHQKLPDGCYQLRLVGLARVAIRELESSRLYRRVEVRPLPEQNPREDDVPALRGRLSEAIRARTQPDLALPERAPVARLADLLLLRIPLPTAELQGLFAELDVGRRAEGALYEHERRPRLK
jgi:Lon protease-like protein